MLDPRCEEAGSDKSNRGLPLGLSNDGGFDSFKKTSHPDGFPIQMFL